ncbi:hypothetical protein MTR62_11970 [Novosphingobium sp. 1949]|uniref:Lipoprotein n=1 Tax=Novosphingobium organovorum TaxID=2930092 RepID=A0ABT0BEE0_9SPHN|nr:hypothetical protein [Novosphingobium organovorum]MCJ2183401.1 hypothetical protein [Novosphingobium organovorum]
MSATLIALALFACNDDGTSCQRLQTPVETYRTSGECFGHLDDILTSEAALRADAPTVYAQCMPSAQLAALGSRDINLARVSQVQLAQR